MITIETNQEKISEGRVELIIAVQSVENSQGNQLGKRNNLSSDNCGVQGKGRNSKSIYWYPLVAVLKLSVSP